MFSGLHLQDGTAIEIDAVPFAAGGEASLHRIRKPAHLSGHLAKIYRSERLNDERRQRVKYLAANRPHVEDTNGHKVLIWIESLILTSGGIVGFTMHEVAGLPLERLCHSGHMKSLHADWRKFDWSSSEWQGARVKLCFNIAAALHNLHSLGRYVLADMKPENIIVRTNGLLSLIDLDSVGVIENGRLLFTPPVATPDYTPPEGRDMARGAEAATEAWDRFSLAVILYRVLCGIHPFTGSCLPPYENCCSCVDKMQAGLFPHSPHVRRTYRVVPPPHGRFAQLKPAVQSLFLRCFGDGHGNPRLRPSASEWCEVLMRRRLPSIKRRAIALNAEDYKPTPPVYRPLLGIPLPDGIIVPEMPSRTLRQVLKYLANPSERTRWRQLQQQRAAASGAVAHLRETVVHFNDKTLQINKSIKNDVQRAHALHRDLEGTYNGLLKEIEGVPAALRDEEARELSQIAATTDAEIENIEQEELRLKSRDWRDQCQKDILQLEVARRRLVESRAAADAEVARIRSQRGSERLSLEKAFHNECARRSAPSIAQTNDIGRQISEMEGAVVRERNERRRRIRHGLLSASLQSRRIAEVAARLRWDSYVDPLGIVDALHRAGIRSAADFMGIGRNGVFTLAGNRYIKIPGIGPARGKVLANWRAREFAAACDSITEAKIDALESEEIAEVMRTINSLRHKLKLLNERIAVECASVTEAYRQRGDAAKQQMAAEVVSAQARGAQSAKTLGDNVHNLQSRVDAMRLQDEAEVRAQMVRLTARREEAEKRWNAALRVSEEKYSSKHGAMVKDFQDRFARARLNADGQLNAIRSKVESAEANWHAEWREAIRLASVAKNARDERINEYMNSLRAFVHPTAEVRSPHYGWLRRSALFCAVGLSTTAVGIILYLSFSGRFAIDPGATQARDVARGMQGLGQQTGHKGLSRTVGVQVVPRADNSSVPAASGAPAQGLDRARSVLEPNATTIARTDTDPGVLNNTRGIIQQNMLADTAYVRIASTVTNSRIRVRMAGVDQEVREGVFRIKPGVKVDLTVYAVGYRERAIRIGPFVAGSTNAISVPLERISSGLRVIAVASTGDVPTSAVLTFFPGRQGVPSGTSSTGRTLRVEIPFVASGLRYTGDIHLVASFPGYECTDSTQGVALVDGAVTTVTFEVTNRSTSEQAGSVYKGWPIRRARLTQ